MPQADFFARLGLFVWRGFVDAELSTSLRSAASLSASTKSSVQKGGTADTVVDESVRRSLEVRLDPATASLVTERLLQLRPRVEAHFNITLTDCEPPQPLVYPEGDLFRAHQDRTHETIVPAVVPQRRVSVLLFFN